MEIICDGNMKKEKLLRGNGNGSEGGKKDSDPNKYVSSLGSSLTVTRPQLPSK